jgi:acetyl esterase
MRAVLDATVDDGDAPTMAEERRRHDAEGARLGGEPEPVAEVRELAVPGPAGDVPVRAHRPARHDSGAPGVVVYLHGGGWCLGSLDGIDPLCRALANASGAVVVSVGYRLAPEHPFPAGLEDTLAVLRWLGAHAGELGADPERLVVAGDSAGGNLAAVAALRLRDEGGPAVRLQALVYPAVDAAADPRQSREGYGLTVEGMRRWWRLYLGGADGLQPDRSPLRAPDLAGLPPAFLVLAELDPLLEEGEAYAAALRDAGVPATVHRCDGAVHGFLRWLGATALAREAVGAMGGAIAAALAR